MDALAIIIVCIPFVLTIWNVFAFIRYLVCKIEKKYDMVIEVLAMCIGAVYLYLYAVVTTAFVNWDVQLYNAERHSMIFPDAAVTVTVIALIAFAGYLLIRFVPADKQSPIASALGIAAAYLGIGLCVLWCVQTACDFLLLLFPANCIILFVKAVYIVVYQKNMLLQRGTVSTKYQKLSGILNKAANLPWLALLFMIPLLGIIIVVLFLFGQEPNSIIKAWTETADWTMSQKIAPQNIEFDEHYLCTVAAGGHKQVVKPLRTGLRHGHRVIVNRQLCVANAFEQVLEERVPAFHKMVRMVYDSTGYPISKHIHSKYLADLIYILMKPLEWIFLLVLYTVEFNPEDRIAVQYPHAPIPGVRAG